MPYLHIINTNNNAGWAILSADSIYAPLLAYDSTGNFDKSNLNPGLITWLNKHAYQIYCVRNNKFVNNDSIAAANKVLWLAFGSSCFSQTQLSTSSNFNTNLLNKPTTYPISYEVIEPTFPYPPKITSVGPLCTTQWNQDYPYDEDCPAGNYSNGHDAAGCVPVAMAQVMHFWNWPNNYNWAIMPSENVPGTTAGYAETARLLFNIGSLDISKFLGFPGQFVSYGSESSANDLYCPDVFNSFGYSSAQRSEPISNQILTGQNSGTYFAGLLTSEVEQNNRPCMVGGYSSNNDILGVEYPSGDGHEWVFDGVYISSILQVNEIIAYSVAGTVISISYIPEQYVTTSSLLHMNWGWGGLGQYNNALSNNGWYNYTVDYTQADPTSENFQYFQTIIYNIHP